MINKQNLWFVTLFSLILVLSIYYITMPDNALKSITAGTDNTQSTGKVENIEESSILVALRVEADEASITQMNALQDILLSETATLEEKNDAYDSLKELNINKGKEEELEKLLAEEYKLKSFIKIKKDHISVVIASADHNTELANNIIRSIQSKYDEKMYITVKFQK